MWWVDELRINEKNIINYVNNAYINKKIGKWENEKKTRSLLKGYVYICL
jgi:hypothetical protein